MQSLSSAEQEALRAAGRARRWKPGETLLRDGEPATSALLLLEGLVKIHKRSSDGTEVILTLSGPGDLLGEIAAVPSKTRSANVTALEAVSGIVIPVPELRGFLTRYPPLSLRLLELANARLRIADQRRLEFAVAESLPRVTSRLVELAERFGMIREDGAIEVSMPITQEELASWAAASRESTARALRKLRDLNLIDTHRMRLVVRDIERLRDHATQL